MIKVTLSALSRKRVAFEIPGDSLKLNMLLHIVPMLAASRLVRSYSQRAKA